MQGEMHLGPKGTTSGQLIGGFGVKTECSWNGEHQWGVKARA